MTNLQDAIADVERLREHGDLLLAFDRAEEHLEAYPDSEKLKYAGLLALARAGATDRAAELFSEWGLDKSEDGDILALEARIAKDRALKLKGTERREALLQAAHAYRQIYEREPNYYPAINWASLAFLAGEEGEAARVAEIVLADPAVSAADDYWGLATSAEAKLVLRRPGPALADLARAAARDAGAGARSSTRRQLRLLLSAQGFDAAQTAAFLAPLTPLDTLQYVDPSGLEGGWRGLPPAALEEIRRTIDAALEELAPGAVLGSLATPAEVLFAEAVLAAGVEYYAILPIGLSDFEKTFLASAGEEWIGRVRACCEKARRVIGVLEDGYVDATGVGDFAARVAMGLALLRAQHLDGQAVQLVLGAAEDSAPEVAWRADPARKQVTLQLPRDAPPKQRRDSPATRPYCAVVFGDVPGFSKLPETALPVFYDTVMGVIGKVVASSGPAVATKNTWGDAIHLVVRDARAAATVCLNVQRALSALDRDVLDRDIPPTMRIGAHFGPVFEGWDAVREVPMFYGNALSKAARIEPITPPGTVYVTEAFAAILLLESHGEFTCTYVGQVPLAKNYGTFRMYDLRAEEMAGS
jgi:class 3 adenylate cyclase